MSERTVIDVSQVVEQQKLGGFLVGLVVISWIITFFDGFDSQAIAFAAPYLSTQYHLDRIMMGNIFSMGLVGALIGGFGFGYLGDRIGRRPAIILATAAFGLLTLAFVFADSYASLLALRLIDGIALGGMLPLSWALNIEYVPKRYRSTVVTVIMIGYSVGIAVGGPAANWLIPQYGWQSLFAVGGALSLVAALALVLILPESARFLASKGWQPRRVADLLRRLTGKAVPADAQFVAADEVGQAKHFNPALLFRDQLRFITPLLWLAYIASSIAVFFLATWTPLVFEALNFTRSQAALAASVNAAAGAVGGLLLMRFTDNIGAIAVTAMPLLAIPPLADCRVCRCRPGRVFCAVRPDRLVSDRWAFWPAQHRRHFLSQRLSRQWRGLGDLGREDRIDRRTVRGRTDPLDEPAGPLHFRGARDLPGRLRRLHLHCRADSFIHAPRRDPNAAGIANGRSRTIEPCAVVRPPRPAGRRAPSVFLRDFAKFLLFSNTLQEPVKL
jgi:AAHS family 4-hydroxybenzoate transporter-like MFS transporter